MCNLEITLYMYNDLYVPFCMLFSDSSEPFLFILGEVFFVLIRAECASTVRVHVMAEKKNLDVYETVFKADADAARHFLTDEAQRVVTSDAQVHVLVK